MPNGDGVDELRCGSARMPSVRTFFVLIAACVTLFLLAWVLLERDRVLSCTGELPPTSDVNQSPSISSFLSALERLQVPVTDNKTATEKSDATNTWDDNWDKKKWANPDDGKGVGSRVLFLVRHGQYHYDTGKLTDTGRMQANLTGQRLRALGHDYKIIIHSTMVRARETAELIHPWLPTVTKTADSMIEEGGPTQPDPPISYWSLPERDYFVNGPRLEAAFRKYFWRADSTQKTTSYEILVGHGNIFRYFTLRALQLPASAWMRVFIAHASITQVVINSDGSVNLSRFGDSGHFLPNMVTY